MQLMQTVALKANTVDTNTGTELERLYADR
jgi:hypothetical protein